MTYTAEQKQSILDQARATLERTSPGKLAESQFRYAETYGDTTIIHSEPVEDPLERWKREANELDAERIRERERLSMVAQLYRSTIKTQHDIAEGLSAVGGLARAIQGRLDEIETTIIELKRKLNVAETRFEDLKRTVDAGTTSAGAEIVELPNPLSKRRA
jgi:hypothetical protein